MSKKTIHVDAEVHRILSIRKLETASKDLNEVLRRMLELERKAVSIN